MEKETKKTSYAVFPFLKTTRRIKIGKIEFRSNEDLDGLSQEEADHIKSISGILFLKDNYRLKNVSIAVIPYLDLNQPDLDVESISRVQAVVSYFYSSPRHEYGDLFLSHEHSSLVLFTPEKTLIHSVSENYNVEWIGEPPQVKPDRRGTLDGYIGLYNFRHYFWVTKFSRLYGPTPRLTLNQSQDLSSDILHECQSRTTSNLLLEYIRKPPTEFSTRVFTAVKWFNSANSSECTQSMAIVNLSIAFESLLKLPKYETTDRLVDAVSLLLGRKSRLDSWAKQFYDARSKIVHEGRALQTRFYTAESPKDKNGQYYQSLLSYGRQIFQLCLGTLLTGAELSERMGLEETLVTNQERFVKLCKLAAKSVKDPAERWESLTPVIFAIEKYLYVPETDLKLETMLGAIRGVSQALLDLGQDLPEQLKLAVKQVVTAPRDKDHYSELEALDKIDSFILSESKPLELGCAMAYIPLVRSVWDKSIQHYMWLKEEKEKDAPPIKTEG